MQYNHYSTCIADVAVSLPGGMLIVGEGDGIVPVCTTLSAMGNTERDFTVMFSTTDITGIIKVTDACIHAL